MSEEREAVDRVGRTAGERQWERDAEHRRILFEIEGDIDTDMVAEEERRLTAARAWNTERFVYGHDRLTIADAISRYSYYRGITTSENVAALHRIMEEAASGARQKWHNEMGRGLIVRHIPSPRGRQ